MNQHTSSIFPVRITRASFLIRGFLLLFGGFITGGLFSSMGQATLVAKIVLAGVGFPLAIFLFIAFFWSLLIPRLRDIGLRPAWSLLILVHSLDGLFLLALLLIPTNALAGRAHTVCR